MSYLVAINCLVYNHESYLRECLDGFVMQQTNFPFVAIVHDDASTDNSAAIIHEYADKYPNIIKPIFERENQYSKRDGTIQRIMNAAVDSTSAKYVAMCEGDDYWTDPSKLQKQVDFMEANPEFSLCFHKVKTLIQETGELKNEFIVRDMPGKSNIVDLAKGNYIHTPSVLYRKECLDVKSYYNMVPCIPSDYVMWMLLAEKGYIYKFNEAMAVYRYGVGIWSGKVSTTNNFSVLKTLTKLSCTIQNPDARTILKEEVQRFSTDLVNHIDNLEQQYNQICSSRAYQLGKLLLKPISFVRKLFAKS